MTNAEQPDLFDPLGRRRQQRWIDADRRRDEAKARFAALPDEERAAIWARVDRLLFVEAKWRIARSMPENPHAYCHRRNFRDDADFRFLIEFLRSGVCDRERYSGRLYDVLNRAHPITGVACKFWCMNWPLNLSDGRWLTVIVNKKPVWETDV